MLVDIHFGNMNVHIGNLYCTCSLYPVPIALVDQVLAKHT